MFFVNSMIEIKNYEYTIVHIWSNVPNVNSLPRAQYMTFAYTALRGSSSSPDINAITNSNKIQPWLVNFVRRTQTPIYSPCVSWFHEGDLVYTGLRYDDGTMHGELWSSRDTMWRTIDREPRPDNPFSSTERRVLHSCRQVPPSTDDPSSRGSCSS